MARGSKSYSYGPTRNLYSFAKPRLFGPINLSSFGSPLSDRRSFYPDPYRPADYSGLRLNRSLVAKPRRGSRSLLSPDRLFFRVPHMVHLCVRRKVRKEVLFARGRVGRGGSSSRPKHRNEHSEVSC